jgi:hypothetical protein
LQLSRHCLDNSGLGRVEGTHVEKIAARKPTPEAGSQIRRELINDFLTVLRLEFSGLFKLDDVSANQPVGCRHNGIDGPRG